MIVVKFGGTSVQNAQWIDRALDVTLSQMEKVPVLVASATAKTTDRLQEIAYLSESGNTKDAEALFRKLKDAHQGIAGEFLTGNNARECSEKLDDLFKELGAIIEGLGYLKERTPRSNDAILSFGELFSTAIIHSRARERGVSAELLDSRSFIKTDANFTSAGLIEDATNTLVRENVRPEKGRLCILQGFIGSTADGITTTLGRGGSDYTAAIVGAALKADEIQIWTDVDGIMTSDPRAVKNVATIPVISYKEAAELAYFGAKVIHPQTIQPAIKLGIPVLVKNTGNPSAEGTKIVSDIPGEGLKAIALKKGITLINIVSYRMLLAHGFLRRIFEIFETFKTPVDLISTSEVSVSMTIDNIKAIVEIEKELSKLGNVTIEQEKSIICLVGQGLWKNPRFISRVFSTIESVPLRMISLGASETNLSFVVPDDQAVLSAQRLHKEFFERGE
jgi:aspartate kinase